MDMDLYLNPVDFQLFDRFGFYKFCLTGFGMDLDLILLGQTPRWLFSILNSIMLWHRFSRHLACFFSGRLRSSCSYCIPTCRHALCMKQR